MDMIKIVRAQIDPDDPNWEFVDASDILEVSLCNFDDSELRVLIKNILKEIDRRARARNAGITRCSNDD